MPKRERMVAHAVMAKRAALIGVALIIAINIITSVQVRAQSKLADSAWPAFRHNALMTAFTPARGPALPEIKWRANFGSGPLGSPVLAADGTIYVPGNADSALYAVTPDGVLKWVYAGKDTEKFVAPLIISEDGTIYFGSTTNIFYAINPNGSVRWRLKLEGPVRYSANIGSDGTIYVAAQDCNLYAVTPAGKLKWKTFLGKLPGNGPAIATDGTIYVVAGELLKGVKPDGTLQLEFNCADMGLLNGLMVEGKELIYVTALEKPFIRAISNTPGIRWEQTFNPSFKGSNMPAMGEDGAIYFSTAEGGGVVALNRNGTERWLFSLSGAKNLTELVVDDSNYVYIVNDKLGLTSLSAAGQLRWSLPAVKCAFSPAIGADGTIYVASDRKLYAVGQKLPDIAADPSALVFPQICVNSSNIDSSLVISNFGAAALNVTRIESSNPAFRVIPPASFTVPPGGQHVVRVEFTPAAAVSYNGTLSIFNDDPDENPVVVNAGGSGGVADIDGLTEAIFDTVEIQTCANIVNSDDTTYVIRNLGVCDLNIKGLIVSGDFAVISPTVPAVVPVNGSLNVVLRFTPQTNGLQNGTLKIQSDDPKDPEIVVALRGTGVAIPDIGATPLVVDFGMIPLGSSLRKSITIRNLGALPLEVERFVVTPSPPFATESKEFVLNCNESDSIVVAFTPVAPGLIEGRLEIFSNDPNASPFVVKLRGNSSGPDIAVDPDTLDFGAVCGGEDSLMFVTVSNEGDEILVINSLTSFPPVFSTTQTTPFSVPPGGSVQIPVEYAYVERREDSGTLTISSNDPDESTVIVALHGKGKAPDIELVTPDSVTVCLGSVEPTPICVFNPSDCVLPFDTDSIEIFISSGSNVLSRTIERLTPTFTANTPILIKPKEQFCLNVNVRGLQLGNLTIEVIVKSNIPGKTLITRSIPVSVVPAEIAGVERVDFGGVEIFTSSEKPAQVWNDGECVVRIDSLKITGPDAAAFAIGTLSLPHTIDAGDTTGIPVIFNPQQARQYTATLLVYNNDSARNPLSIVLSGVGTDTTGSCDPRIAVQPTALQFGEVIEKRSLTKFAIVKNAGRCELVISALKVVGRDSLAFVAEASSIPLTLAQQESDSLAVTFTPPNPGSFIATLLVFNNDTTNNPLEIALTGVGVECPPVIVVDPTALHFGEVALSRVLERMIKVSNTSDCDTLHVRDVNTNTPTPFFVDSTDMQFDLAPGASHDVKVYFAPVAAILYSDSLKITSDDPTDSLVIVPLTGKGKLPYTVTPDPVIFPQTCVGSESFVDVTICNIGNFDLIASPITTAGPQFREEIDDLLIPTGSDSCQTIRISFLPDKVGAFHDTLTVVWDPSLNLPPLKVPLSGQGIGPQIAGNKTLDFGDLGIGNTSTKPDTVFNNSLCVLRIDSLKIIGKDTSDFHLVNFNPNNLPSNINPNGFLILSVEFAPQALGERTAELHIWSNDPDSTDIPFIVQLRGNGVTGILAACENIDFGKTCADNPVTKECTFTNTSKIADLEINSLRLASGRDFHLGSVSLPARLKPNSSITISIILAPVKTGDKRDAQDTVFISSKFSEQEHRITLLGHKRSEDPDIVLNTLSLEFQSPVGIKTDCQAAQITNEGCSPLEVSDLKLAGYTTNVFEICPGLQTPFKLKLGDLPQPVDVFFMPIDFREFKDELRIYNDDPDKNPATVALVGRVPSGNEVCLRPDSTRIRFGSIFIKTEKTVRLGVTNCSNPAALIKVEASLASRQEFAVAPDSLPNVTPSAKQYLNITFRPLETGERSDTLRLVVTSVFNANVRTELEIILQGTGIDDEVYARPNAFTPNDDNKNDFAKIHFPGYKMLSPVLRIYDLRGIAVRVLRRLDNGGDEIAWDGYDNEGRGRLMPPGAYVWLLEDQGKKVGSGVIVLIR